MNPLLRTILILPLCLQAVRAQPEPAFPFNAQLPPVARIGSLYTYTFPAHTFQSDSDITYSLGKHPEWLSLDSESRRLYGIPDDSNVPPGEVVGQDFQIVGTDDNGASTMDATIVVAREDGPTVKVPISQQIKDFGDYSSPSSILSYPSTDFNYTFDANTFRHDSGMINYYASSGNSSPLPAWIRFDASTLAFSGTTPGADALFQPPQQFDIRLIASDIEGFSSTSVEFSIVVSAHKLTAENPVIELNASRGRSFEYERLADEIKLDNKAVDTDDVNVTATNLPSWITFNPKTWVISGKPAKGDHSTNFTLNFKDEFTDNLKVWATVNVATTGLFTSTFRDVEVTPGEDFSLDLSSHFKNPKDIEAKIRTKPAQKWLALKGQKLEGKVPKSASGDLEVSIEAKSRSTGESETESLSMMFSAPDGTSTNTLTTTVTVPSETHWEDDGEKEDGDGDGANKDASNDGDGGIGTSAILLATIIPVVFLALLIMLLVCFIRRRRNRQHYLSKKFRTKISHPVAGSLRVNGSSEATDTIASSEEGEITHVATAAEKRGYVQANSQPSSRSSDTLGSLSSRDMSRMYMYNAGPEGSRGLTSSDTEGGRDSWFTEPTGLRSADSTRSRGSETTLPFSTHQLLPTPPFLAQPGESDFRGGLDLAISSLDEFSSSQTLHDQPPRRPPRSEAMYSTITTSSAALPLSRPGSPPSQPLPPIATAMSVGLAGGKRSKSDSDKDWSTIREDESEEQVSDLRPPGHARLSSNQRLSRRTVGTRDSLFSIESFGSTENWRVIGRPEQSAPNLQTYRSIIDMAPFNPSRPETPPPPIPGTSAKAEEQRSQSPLSKVTPESSSGGGGSENIKPEEVVKTSHSRFHRLNYTSSSSNVGDSSNWKREGSGQTSEGSFKVFI